MTAGVADIDLARVLSRHYGDGAVYLPRQGARREVLRRAVDRGLVSSEGFITRKGRHLLARFKF